MKTIVCYGDSNTWGYIPVTGHRLPVARRWTGLMAAALGSGYKVEEEAVNGRTTCFDDPIYPMRSGTEYLEEALLANYPIDLVIIMLGTNDSKIHLRQTSFSVSVGLERLIKTVQKNPEYGPEYGEDGKTPEILVISPPHLGKNISECRTYNDFDENSAALIKGLAPLYKGLCELYGCAFLDASDFAEASREDALHITAESHTRLAAAVTAKVRDILEEGIIK